MRDWLETKFWEFAVWLIRRGYGGPCKTKDLKDFPGLSKHAGARCPTCYANDMIEWIGQHIEVINYK